MSYIKTVLKMLIITSLLIVSVISLKVDVFAQESPSYSFITFTASYTGILSAARKNGYQIKEEEINSLYGKYHILLEKSHSFYSEKVYLFFNEEKNLISFTIEYSVGENQSRTVLDKLVFSITEKLVEKYGPNENETFPYYRNVANEYEVEVKPRQSFSGFARVAFKYPERVDQYEVYYHEEVGRLEDQEIEKTVNNF